MNGYTLLALVILLFAFVATAIRYRKAILERDIARAQWHRAGKKLLTGSRPNLAELIAQAERAA